MLHASCKRILNGANLTLHSTAPHEVTFTLDLFVMFYCAVSQITRVTKRPTFLIGGWISTLACPSQHSRWACGRVPYTVVWGWVEVDQLLFCFSHQSVSVGVSMKLVVQEWYFDSCAIFLFQFWSNHVKGGQLLPASFQIATSGDAMTLTFFSQDSPNNLSWIDKSDNRPWEL